MLMFPEHLQRFASMAKVPLKTSPLRMWLSTKRFVLETAVICALVSLYGMGSPCTTESLSVNP